MGQFVGKNDVDNSNTEKSLKPFRDDVFLGIALGATEPHRIEKLIPPVITNTREWLLYMAGTDPETLKGYYDKNGDGQTGQIVSKKTTISWTAGRRSSMKGMQVSVTGTGLSGKKLSVDILNGANADQYINALSSNGISLNNPVVLSIGVYDNGTPFMSERLRMSIKYGDGENSLYDTFYCFDNGLTFETLTSDDDNPKTVYVDNQALPAVYVVDRNLALLE